MSFSVMQIPCFHSTTKLYHRYDNFSVAIQTVVIALLRRVVQAAVAAIPAIPVGTVAQVQFQTAMEIASVHSLREWPAKLLLTKV